MVSKEPHVPSEVLKCETPILPAPLSTEVPGRSGALRTSDLEGYDKRKPLPGSATRLKLRPDFRYTPRLVCGLAHHGKFGFSEERYSWTH
jgi:hypothetical protein